MDTRPREVARGEPRPVAPHESDRTNGLAAFGGGLGEEAASQRGGGSKGFKETQGPGRHEGATERTKESETLTAACPLCPHGGCEGTLRRVARSGCERGEQAHSPGGLSPNLTPSTEDSAPETPGKSGRLRAGGRPPPADIGVLRPHFAKSGPVTALQANPVFLAVAPAQTVPGPYRPTWKSLLISQTETRQLATFPDNRPVVRESHAGHGPSRQSN